VRIAGEVFALAAGKPVMVALIGLLTLLIAVVGGLGVLNTVVLQTRER